MDEIAFDESLPWPQFLSKEILNNLEKSSSLLRTSALAALSSKLRLAQVDNDHKIEDEKVPYVILKALVSCSSFHDWKALFDPLSQLLKLQTSNEVFLKNSVKYFDKLSSDTSEASSAFILGFFFLEFFRLCLSLGLVSNTSGSFEHMVAVSRKFRNTVVSNGKLLKRFTSAMVHLMTGSKSSIYSKKVVKADSEKTDLFFGYLQSNLGSGSLDLCFLIGCLYKDEIIQYFIKSVLSSKTSVSLVDLQALERFLSEQIDQEVFESQIFPVFERLLLRSPEVALFDQFKSANETTRANAVLLWKEMCKTTRSEDSVRAICGIALKNITAKAPSRDQKASFYLAVADICTFPEVAETVLDKVSALCDRESDQNLLHILVTQVLAKCIGSVVKSKDFTSQIEKIIFDGLKVAQHPKRFSFVYCLVSCVDTLCITESEATKIIEKLVALVVAVQNAGLALLDPKKETPVFGEAVLAYSWILKASIAFPGVFEAIKSSPIDIAQIVSAKSVILSQKYYSKLLSSEFEFECFTELILDALMLIQASNGISGCEMGLLSDGLEFLMLHVPFYQTRQGLIQRIGSLSKNATEWTLSHDLLLETASKGLASLSYGNEVEKIEIVSSTNKARRLYSIVRALLPTKELAIPFLEKLSIVAHHPAFVRLYGSDSWMRLVFECDLQPVEVLDSFLDRTLASWTSRDTVNFDASLMNAVSVFVGLAPKKTLEALVPWILQTLASDQVQALTHDDIMIFKTPSDTVYHDPLQKKASDKQNKKKVDPLSKFNQPKNDQKLSKQDKELIQKQLEIEAEIRSRVQTVLDSVLNGFRVLQCIIDSLSERMAFAEQDDEFFVAFSTFVAPLLRGLEKNILEPELYAKDNRKTVFFAEDGLKVYFGLISVSGLRFRELVHTVPRLATAILRLRDCDESLLDPYLTSKSIDGLVLECLKVLKHSYTPSNPLDIAGLSVLVPLLELVVLDETVYTTIPEKTYTEMILYIADLVFAHATLGVTNAIERDTIAKIIVCLVENYPRLAKKGEEGLIALSSGVGASQHPDPSDDYTIKQDLIEYANNPTSVANVLLDALLNPTEDVRSAALQSLIFVELDQELVSVFELISWILMHDSNETVSQTAKAAWQHFKHDALIDKRLLPKFIDTLTLPIASLQEASAIALNAALKVYPESTSEVLQMLFHKYIELVAPPIPRYDEFGIMIKESLEKPNNYAARLGVATSLKHVTCFDLSLADVEALFKFLIGSKALADEYPLVRKGMLEAGLGCIKAVGKKYMKVLLGQFESHLKLPDSKTEEQDAVRESVVVLMGTLAQDMESSDPRVPKVIDQLVAALNTPSEAVQIAVSECLPDLVSMAPAIVGKLVDQLFDTLFTSEKYGERKGAAYGLAAVIKGRKVGALKEFGILDKLREAAQDKKSLVRRESAMFVFQTLSNMLGRLFEPYVIQILPILLVCYGDNSRDVRQATDDASKTIMSNLSGHCVKLLLPSLLKGLADESWRTQTGSIEVLGSMASLAPKQLSSSLPQIIPRLNEVLIDSHYKVVDAAKAALNNFGKIIKNPEISNLVPVILDALVDPNEKTDAALNSLLETEFIHYIDAPSLALIIPVLLRGLKERATETKRKSAQVIGNMAMLAEKKDIVPYLSVLDPSMREVLMDPAPVARATVARALGSMVAKLGEENFPSLVADLMATLSTDTSAVDRSGAAQGLSEVVSGIGLTRLESLLPTVIANCKSAQSHVREGFLTLLVYLPVTFGDKFTPYIGDLIPCILLGLSDESDIVRDASLRAGQIIVRNYALLAVDLLLPKLEHGLFDDNFRIRHSSMQLLGDLLYRIAGVSGKAEQDTLAAAAEDEDEETAATEFVGVEHSKKALVDTLGLDRYQKVLSSIYMLRQDSHALVRQTSIHVWKSLIPNTPRALREIFPVLTTILIQALPPNQGDDEDEKQGMAARTFADLVRKLGEGILVRILPIFEASIDAPDHKSRQGVCIAVSEIVSAAGKQYVEEFVFDCLVFIKKGLVDPEGPVRNAAAGAFGAVFQCIGQKAIDEVLPDLMNKMRATEHSSENYALEGLGQIVAVKGNVIFPILIPNLIQTPITSFNARVLALLMSVSGPALNRRLTHILPSLMDGLDQPDTAAVDDIRKAVRSLVLSVEDEQGVDSLLGSLREMLETGSLLRKRHVCEALVSFFSETEAEFDEFIPDFLEKLIPLLSFDEDEVIISLSWSALDSLVKRIPKEDMVHYVVDVRRSIKESFPENLPVAGFCLAKGLSPCLSVFLNGFMYGDSDVKEQAAYGLGDLVKRATPEALKPFVTQIVGPLIRVSGDRISIGLKTGILESLGDLLSSVPAMLRPFVPQLQRTFMRCLADTESDIVREEAAKCLELLIPLQPRLDPLVTEICQGIKANQEDTEIQRVYYEALASALRSLSATRTISESVSASVEEIVEEGLTSDEIEIKTMAASCFAAYVNSMGAEKGGKLVRNRLSNADSISPLHVKPLLLDAAQLLKEANLLETVLDKCLTGISRPGEKDADIMQCLRCIAPFSTKQEANPFRNRIVMSLVALVKSNASYGPKREALATIKTLAKQSMFVQPELGEIVGALMPLTKDKNGGVKNAAERCLVHVLCATKGNTDRVLKLLDPSVSKTARDLVSKLSKQVSDDEDD